ncbi:hypothetical protein BX600DRAFT_439724 [Xylariales sp. PMI_506]|nr:hypothetical protein BX600DRAFT_439724 [Xylariales sp. PMI_506]
MTSMYKPPAEEITKRLQNEVVENQDTLNEVEFNQVAEAFSAWIQARCLTEWAALHTQPTNTRFTSCIVIDKTALESLKTLPTNPPPVTGWDEQKVPTSQE